MNPFTTTITRSSLLTHLASMPPKARGRGEIERLLVKPTNAELAQKPRVRVQAVARELGKEWKAVR